MVDPQKAVALLEKEAISVRTLFRTAAWAYGLFTGTFGLLLMVSHRYAKMLPTPSYTLLTNIPYWPISVGSAFLTMGLLLSYTTLFKPAYAYSQLYYVAAILWVLYGVLFIVGTVIYGGLWGPQMLYLAMAVYGGSLGSFSRISSG